jgi:adenylate kinase family enzyme
MEIGWKLLSERLEKRYSCEKCYQLYQIDSNSLLRCPIDNQKLIKRQDDDVEIIQQRFQTFQDQTKPLWNFFQQHSMFEILHISCDHLTIHEIKEIIHQKINE